MDFKREKRGRISLVDREKDIGHVDYTYKDTRTLTLDATEVDPEYRGQGLAKKLVLKAVDYARKEGFKIIPVCSYAVVLFKRMEKELEDVQA